MSGILSKLSSTLSGVLSNSNKDSVVGIDFGGSTLKVVQLKKERGKIILETYGAISLAGYQNKNQGEIIKMESETLVLALKDIFEQSDITCAKVAVSVSSSASLVFVLELPKSTENELEKIIPNEARKFIPVPIEEVALDWWKTQDRLASEAGRIRVLVVAIQKDYLNSLEGVVKEGQLEPLFYEAEVFSNIRASNARSLQPVALIDFGASSVRVAIVEYGVVQVFHTIPKSGFYLTKLLMQAFQIEFQRAEILKKDLGILPNVSTDKIHKKVPEIISGGVREIADDIRQIIQDYETQRNKVVSNLILTGGASRLKGLVEYLEERFGVTTLISAPFSIMENPSYLEEVLEEIGPEFNVAVGVALRALL